jgi:D-serine deaminase-like pyridoxal phosphate-dependent protein
MLNSFPWHPGYRVSDIDNVLTPALVVYPEIIESNIARTLHLLGGDADRWRAHIKTAKLAYSLRMLVERGCRNLKCATTLELLAACRSGAGPQPCPSGSRLARSHPAKRRRNRPHPSLVRFIGYALA